MPYRVDDKTTLKEHYEKFCINQEINLINLDANYKELYWYLHDKYNKLVENNYPKYKFDLYFGLALYEFLNKKDDFCPLYESNYDFWAHIAINVIPDIIAKRHNGAQNHSYYYSKNVRIYPYAIYWYIHLSWQGDAKKTLEILENNSTDEILQLVERPTKIGINVELYRKIMKKYSTIDNSKLSLIKNGKKISLFRMVLMKNTAKIVVFRPEIYPNGIDGYVDMLFENIEVQ